MRWGLGDVARACLSGKKQPTVFPVQDLTRAGSLATEASEALGLRPVPLDISPGDLDELLDPSVNCNCSQTA